MPAAWRFLLFAWVAARLAAQPAIPAAEAFSSPTPARLAAIHAAAQPDGWDRQTAGLRAVARRAYERGNFSAALAWLNLCRWAALLGRDEGDFTVHWMQTIQSAGVNRANLPTRYQIEAGPLSRRLAPDFQLWLIGHPDFSDEFFALLQPVDRVPRVFEILNGIYQDEPAAFATHASLALAIAVVYDVPPPPDWPHIQVSATALPRRWPDPSAAFRWWTQQAQLGHLFHRLELLPADELKFVVDAAAPFDELAWSQQVANYPLRLLARVYPMIRYRPDRAANEGAVWSEGAYSLPAILGAGGICVDQAYFATEVGKARGVPTLLFHGAGNDGRHAWFGFLDGDRKWQLDAGRYAGQKFVTGFARDPQTWLEISDHELKFLAERFHAQPSFRRSRVHADFAADYLATGEVPAALAAARRAVEAERRNQAAWEVLLAAEAAGGGSPTQREATLREAMDAFRFYPDLEAFYSSRLSSRLRAGGEVAAAEAEQRRIARKYRGDRSDLSVRQAGDRLRRSIATQPLAEQIRTYNSAVDQFGRQAGMAFFDQIVRGFVAHLVELGQPAEALRAAARARAALRVEPDSQLDREFENLLRPLQPER